MAETLGAFFQDYFSPEIVTLIISMLPILELRGGLLVAKFLGVSWLSAYPICIVGNLIPVPFILAFIRQILMFLEKHGPLKRMVKFIESKGKRGGDKLQSKYPRYIYLGLLLFVAIPLPGTGAWTGSLIAALLDLDKKKSFLMILLGVVSASVIMSIIAYAIPGAFGL